MANPPVNFRLTGFLFEFLIDDQCLIILLPGQLGPAGPVIELSQHIQVPGQHLLLVAGAEYLLGLKQIVERLRVMPRDEKQPADLL
ncbi:hypothetical protein D3C87_1805540 [compost metagenome]